MNNIRISILDQIKSLTVFELVLTCVVSVAIGVSFWGWTFVYEMAKPILKLVGLNYLLAGFWIFASVFLSKIVQKPGIAILASLVAALVESLLTKWGLMTLLWGLVQGLGAEIIFFIFSYKRWNVLVLCLAAALSTLFSFILDYYFYEYGSRALGLNLMQLVSYLVSGIFFAGILSGLFAKRLLRLGLLDQFLIAKEN